MPTAHHARIFMRWRLVFPSCQKLPSLLPNCWRSIFNIFAKNQRWQLNLPNCWRCSNWFGAVLVWILRRFLGHLRASPRVWQIELTSLIFGKNIKNTPPTVWQKTWAIFGNLGKTSLQRVNIRARRAVGIVFLVRWEGEKRNK